MDTSSRESESTLQMSM